MKTMNMAAAIDLGKEPSTAAIARPKSATPRRPTAAASQPDRGDEIEHGKESVEVCSDGMGLEAAMGPGRCRTPAQ